ncbi:MAG: zinc ribbon domain-containing protein [Candidatus Hodarchaeales archaeon]|jgi:hypothetical protein
MTGKSVKKPAVKNSHLVHPLRFSLPSFFSLPVITIVLVLVVVIPAVPANNTVTSTSVTATPVILEYNFHSPAAGNILTVSETVFNGNNATFIEDLPAVTFHATDGHWSVLYAIIPILFNFSRDTVRWPITVPLHNGTYTAFIKVTGIDGQVITTAIHHVIIGTVPPVIEVDYITVTASGFTSTRVTVHDSNGDIADRELPAITLHVSNASWSSAYPMHCSSYSLQDGKFEGCLSTSVTLAPGNYTTSITATLHGVTGSSENYPLVVETKQQLLARYRPAFLLFIILSFLALWGTAEWYNERQGNDQTIIYRFTCYFFIHFIVFPLLSLEEKIIRAVNSYRRYQHERQEQLERQKWQDFRTICTSICSRLSPLAGENKQEKLCKPVFYRINQHVLTASTVELLGRVKNISLQDFLTKTVELARENRFSSPEFICLLNTICHSYHYHHLLTRDEIARVEQVLRAFAARKEDEEEQQLRQILAVINEEHDDSLKKARELYRTLEELFFDELSSYIESKARELEIKIKELQVKEREVGTTTVKQEQENHVMTDAALDKKDRTDKMTRDLELVHKTAAVNGQGRVIIPGVKKPATPVKTKGKKKKKKRKTETPETGETVDYFKTRIFPLELSKKASYITLPPVYQQAVETAREKCKTDFDYCFKWLKAGKKEKYYFKLFNVINVILPVINHSSRGDFTEAYLQVHDSAVETVFKVTYPGEYLGLVKRVQTVLGQLSAVNPSAFKKTSNFHVKKQIINCNNPILASLKRMLTQSGETDALWQLYTAFNPGNGETSATFITRAFWMAIYCLFFAYREKIIRDKSIQLLASYLSKPELVTNQELLHFFREEKLSRELAWKLYSTDSSTEKEKESPPCLFTDLIKHFPGWGAVPKWNYYLNELRQVRNITCENFDDQLLLAAFQHLKEPVTINYFKGEVIKSFTDHISSLKGNKKNQTLEEYLVDLLVHYKLKHPLRKLFLKIWNVYIKGKNKVTATRTTPEKLIGLRVFIYNFSVEYFEKKEQVDFNYTELNAKEAWNTVRKAMKKRIDETRDIFKQSLAENPRKARAVLEQVAEKAVRQFIEGACQVKTSTGQLHFPHKRKVFRAFHRATPLKSFDLAASGVIHPSRLQPCLEEFILSRFTRKAEELIRPALAGVLLKKLRQTLATPSLYVNKSPVIKKPGFSLGYVDNQMHRLDLGAKTFKLALVKTPHQATWFDFTINDQYDRLQPFFKTSTVGEKEVRQWEAQTPQVTFKRGKLALHIPFKKTLLPPICEITLNEPVEEIKIGNDLGLGKYDYISVIRMISIYRQTKDLIVQQILDWKELAHYSIDDLEALHKEFDMKTGTFKNLRIVRDVKGQVINNKNGERVYLRYKRNGNRKKEKSRNTWGKGHLREVFTDIRETQAEINRLMENFPDTHEILPKYQKLAGELSDLWDEHGRVLKAIVTGVAVKVRDIALYWQSRHPDLSLRVQVEDLRWSQHSKRSEAGYFLAHNQKNFFHSQVQHMIAHLLREHGIGVWRVDARNTSQTCAICGHLEESQRHGKTFKCRNENHRNSKGNAYTCNSDLNAGRNVALFPPLTLTSLIP